MRVVIAVSRRHFWHIQVDEDLALPTDVVVRAGVDDEDGFYSPPTRGQPPVFYWSNSSRLDNRMCVTCRLPLHLLFPFAELQQICACAAEVCIQILRVGQHFCGVYR